MVFSTIIFLFRFLPITLALYYLAPAKLKNTVLFLCSLVFYCWGEVRFFPVMVALILINYISGLCIEHFDQKPALRRTFLLVALIGSLGMLFYFKYANFVLRSANALLGTAFAEIQGIGTLPLGISFYTFQTLSYSIDVYRRDVKAERNIIDFGAYVVMFPQLIAGPIVKYRDVSNQLHVYKHRYTLSQIEEGMTLFTFGLAKKVLLANNIGALWEDIKLLGDGSVSTPLAWLGLVAFTLQIYFDFSGYSDMAIGLGQVFGFHFRENFDHPYDATCIRDFWRKWHISLSSWFKDYVYIPLGGNRKGKVRTAINKLNVFFLTGLWHGANWPFVVWGLFHGCFLMLEEFVPKLQKLPRVVAHIYSLLVVTVGFVIFRADTLSQGWMFIRKMFSDFSMSAAGNSLAMQQMTPWFIFILVIAVLCAAPVNSLVKGIRSKMTEGSKGLAVCGTIKSVFTLVLLLWCMIRLSGNAYNPFIYFRF